MFSDGCFAPEYANTEKGQGLDSACVLPFDNIVKSASVKKIGMNILACDQKWF